MSAPRKLNPDLQNFLNGIAQGADTTANKAVNHRGEKIQALRDSFNRMRHGRKTAFKPGDLVRYQAGLKNCLFPKYGEVMVVVEVLDTPVFSTTPPVFSPYFRSPEDLVLGTIREGNFHFWHYDGRRFEKVNGDAHDNKP